LASHTAESFRLNSEATEGTVTVEAAYSKHRRRDVLPLPRRLIPIVKPWLDPRAPGQLLWRGAWTFNSATMLRMNFDAAGIDYRTVEGYSDFHAQLHGTLTRDNRVMPLTDLQAFARRGKLAMTMRYVHTSAP
jgi:hypothetical protein